ncbi:hypothetical protein SAMN05421678_11662 [Actinopolymorpha cephalotaxi]|uniref:Uncharacterized protein n=1 Tax=Actinopolymorpha cephalotaxi TaxID=504797 RepID=A0A1I2ZET6_9ACTN|nr:hypothetical protein [Actinopolymorpha cephalotaxi]NYH81949.1 hypothetical protein [Actinopolymorpha cephalotaxi]SFH36358.1 hypothetical protein SAMN05421678_11662 [Actinopolymorpha cephalotaxi]
MTLVTGDRVRVATRSDGVSTATPIPAAGRRGTTFGIRQHGRNLDVVPADAAPLVASGRLDPRLFEVAGLVRAGLGDERTRHLPLVVAHPTASGASTTSTDSARSWIPRAFRPGRAVPSLRGRAVAEPKAAAGRNWRWLATTPSHVWLDVPKRAGAPAAGTARSAKSGAAQADATYTLTLRVIDRAGRLVTDPSRLQPSPTVVADLDTGDLIDLAGGPTGLVAQLAPGTYSFSGIVSTTQGTSPASYTLLSAPRISVGAATTVTLDARQAHLITTQVDAASPTTVVTTFGLVETVAGGPFTTLLTLQGNVPNQLYARATGSVTDRTYEFTVFRSLAAGSVTYDLLLGQQGSVPANPAYVVHDSALTRYDAAFAAPGAGLNLDGVWFREAELPGDSMIGLGWYFDVPLPARRTHLFSPQYAGRSLAWSDNFDARSSPTQVWYSEVRDPLRYASGQQVRHTFSPAAYRPQAEGYRQGDGVMNFSMAPLSPSLRDGTLIVNDSTGITATSTLRRAGSVVATSTDPFILNAGAQPKTRASYTLDVRAGQHVPWSRYATTVTGHWEFASAAPAGYVEPIPLLNTVAVGTFDLLGRARAGQPFTLNLMTTSPDVTATVTRTLLWVSYDDGHRWTQVPTTPGASGRWSAQVAHPNLPGRFVSVRTLAEDDRGNELTMTSIRAYGLS